MEQDNKIPIAAMHYMYCYDTRQDDLAMAGAILMLGKVIDEFRGALTDSQKQQLSTEIADFVLRESQALHDYYGKKEE